MDQGGVHLEIVIVNDGSKDNTHQICLELAEKHPEIKYFNKENGGANSARKFGALHSTGEFITFSDADDTLAPNALSVMLERARINNLDIVVGCSHDYALDGSVDFIQRNKIVGIFNATDYCEGILNAKIIYGPSCRLVRRSLVSEDDYDLPHTIVFNEDVYVNVAFGLKAKSAGVYDDIVVYNHITDNPDSICHTMKMSEAAWIDLFDRLSALNKRNGSLIHKSVLQRYFERKIRSSFYNKGLLVKDKHLVRKYLFNSIHDRFKSSRSLALYCVLAIPFIDKLYAKLYKRRRQNQ
jgi:glycosyltransferase involved in cell wall biosynthesis